MIDLLGGLPGTASSKGCNTFITRPLRGGAVELCFAVRTWVVWDRCTFPFRAGSVSQSASSDPFLYRKVVSFSSGVTRSRPDGVFNRTDLKRNYSPGFFSDSTEEQLPRRGSERTPKILFGASFPCCLFFFGFPVSGGEILDYSTTPQWQLQRFQGFKAGAETDLGLLSAEFTFCSH